MASGKKHLTIYDLYRLAAAEDMVQNNSEGYSFSMWDFVDDEVEDHFNNLSQSAQDELEERLKNFTPEVADDFEVLGKLQEEDFIDDQEFLEERKSIIDDITSKIEDEFEDYIVDED